LPTSYGDLDSTGVAEPGKSSRGSPFLKSWASNHCNKLALHIGVAVNVPLGGLDRPVAGEQLEIPQRPTGFVHEPCGPGVERPPSERGH
jgi:hypothetical protein